MASSLEGLTEIKTTEQSTVKEDKDFFQQWLSGKLKYYNADEEVFLPYITSILEEADTGSTQSDDVLESLSDILEGLGLNEGENNDGKLKSNKYLTIFSTSRIYFPITNNL